MRQAFVSRDTKRRSRFRVELYDDGKCEQDFTVADCGSAKEAARDWLDPASFTKFVAPVPSVRGSSNILPTDEVDAALDRVFGG